MFRLPHSFIFSRQDSLIHRLDIRVKIIIFIEFLILSLILFNIRDQLTLLSFLGALIFLSKIERRILNSLAFITFLMAMIFILNLIISKEIIISLSYSLRFLLIILTSSSFFQTISPDELEYFLRLLRVPRYLRFAFISALRFVPLLMLDLIQITDSQRARGLELDKGNIFKRIKNRIPILIPLIISTINRSSQMAEALETRAFNSTKKDVLCLNLNFEKRDLIFLFIFFLPSLLTVGYYYIIYP
ncbi:MAG: energy-coupling factor transporter transmembrane component T [Nitrososphaerales archaeon]